MKYSPYKKLLKVATYLETHDDIHFDQSHPSYCVLTYIQNVLGPKEKELDSRIFFEIHFGVTGNELRDIYIGDWDDIIPGLELSGDWRDYTRHDAARFLRAYVEFKEGQL